MAIAVILVGLAALAVVGIFLRTELTRRARVRKRSRYFSISLAPADRQVPVRERSTKEIV